MAFAAASIFLSSALGARRDMLPRPYCFSDEPLIQLFANPPIGPGYLIAWRKDQPEKRATLTRTKMIGQCYLVTKSKFDRLAPSGLKWDDGVCVTLRTPDGAVRAEECN